MRNYDHIFFDLDRTLWDFDSNSREALTEIFDELDWGSTEVPDAQEFITTYQQINERCWDQYRRGLIEKNELRVLRFRLSLAHYDLHDEEQADFLGDRYVEISPRKTILETGTIEVLDYLKSKSYRLHIITNGFAEVQHIKLDNSGLTSYFEEVIISEHVGEKKPHPLVFNHALAQAGAQAGSSLMIGDDWAVDVDGAAQVGMDQVYYNPGKRAGGASTFEIRELRELQNFL